MVRVGITKTIDITGTSVEQSKLKPTMSTSNIPSRPFRGSLTPRSPQSPHAIAKAAMAAAFDEQKNKKRQMSSADDDGRCVDPKDGVVGGNATDDASSHPRISKRNRGSTYDSINNGGGGPESNPSSAHRQASVEPSNSNPFTDTGDKRAEHQFAQVWEDFAASLNGGDRRDADDCVDAVVEATEAILANAIESLTRKGLSAFHDLEAASRSLSTVEDVAEARGRELHRLQASETQSRDAVSNLLRAVETAKGETRDASRAAQIEARLRGEISALRSERDEALGTCAEAKRKCSLLEEQVRLIKGKLSRVAQEKVKMERDSRAAISLAKSLDNHASSDSDFYKRKAAELNDRLQSQQALVAEQKLHIDEMRRQMERTLSQNRLAQLRAEDVGGNRKRRY